MKRLVLAVAALTFAMGVSAQTIVSTEVQKRNVVIEEYTGINCTWCPLGHQIVGEYTKDKGADRVVPINIHTGGFAANTYTTKYGDKIASQTNLTGYPAASVNRTVLNCKIDASTPYNNQGKNAFHVVSDPILEEDSPVNIAATVNVNGTARTATIKVEIYYTKDMAQEFNLLNVAMLQNNVLGTQINGGGYNTSQIVEGGKYRHMHMFRDFVTGQWGDTVAFDVEKKMVVNEETNDTTYYIPAGTFVSKEYTYEIPDQISNEDVVIPDIYFIAFITDGTTEGCAKLNSANIWTGITMQPVFENMPAYAGRFVYSVIEPIYGKCDGRVALGANIRNIGTQTATSIKINYGIEGQDVHTYTWNGNLESLADTTVAMPDILEVTLGQKMDVYMEIVDINGTAFEKKMTSSIKKAAVKSGVLPVTLTFKTDEYASDLTWNLYDSEGNVLQSGGGYEDGKAVYDTIVLDKIPGNGCYSFEILDAYGDGFKSGNYKLKDSKGTTLASNTSGSWGKGEKKDFRIGTVGLNDANENIFQSIVYPNPAKENFTLSVSVVNPSSAVINVLDVMGREVLTLGEQSLKSGENQFSINIAGLENGMYYVRVVTNNGITTNKLSVKK